MSSYCVFDNPRSYRREQWFDGKLMLSVDGGMFAVHSPPWHIGPPPRAFDKGALYGSSEALPQELYAHVDQTKGDFS